MNGNELQAAKSDIVKVLSKFVGLSIWDVNVTEYGISFQCGTCVKVHYLKDRDIPAFSDGEISCRIQTTATLIKNEKVVIRSTFPQSRHDKAQWQQMLEGKIIEKTLLSEGNVLHILLTTGILLSASPLPERDEQCWEVYDRTTTDHLCYIVFRDNVTVGK